MTTRDITPASPVDTTAPADTTASGINMLTYSPERLVYIVSYTLPGALHGTYKKFDFLKPALAFCHELLAVYGITIEVNF